MTGISQAPRVSPTVTVTKKGRPICVRTVKLPGDAFWNTREQRWETVSAT